MLGICPEARMIDISHEVAPYAISEGAFTLSQAWSFFPVGTVHLIVVDPGVGSARRPIAVEAAGHCFVAPDNGVLTILYDVVAAHTVREITAAQFFRRTISRTFHGRDIFSPVAAHLARGLAPAELGNTISDYVRLGFSKPAQAGANTWSGTILRVDRFGNLVTNLDSASWQHLIDHKFEMRIGWHVVTRAAQTYGEMRAGEMFVIAGSSGLLEVSVNQASAAQLMEARAGAGFELHVFEE
jgi:hypothetical protein